MFIIQILLLLFVRELSANNIGMKAFQEYYQQVMIRGNSADLTEVRGFINENHTVETRDGYLLSVFRIRKSYLEDGKSQKSGYPFIILHGLFSDSESFQRASDGFFLKDSGEYVEFEENFTRKLVVDCQQNIGRMLAFNLAACGYDVWLMNVRDSPEYSGHTTFRKDLDPEFWNTTLDSYTEDLRSVLNHVLKTTDHKSSALLCHSAGCSTVFQLLIDHPETNKQLEPIFLVAPYIYTGNIFSVLLASSILEPIVRNYLSPTWSFRQASEIIVEMLATHNEWFTRLYGSLFSFLGGFSADEFDWSRITRIAAHIPGTSASRLVSHVGQRRNSDRFSRFDYYDRHRNMLAYGRPTAPDYDLSTITNTKMILFTGLYDTIVPFPEIERLKTSLKVRFVEEIRTPNSHMDFIFGRNVNQTVNLHVIRLLKHFNH